MMMSTTRISSAIEISRLWKFSELMASLRI